MSIQRPRTPCETAALAGRAANKAIVAVTALTLLSATLPALAQATPPGGVRDPLKPDKVGEGPKVKVSDQNTVDLHVKDEDLSNVLELLSIQTHKNIIASKNVSAKVTATLYGVTFDQALDAILHVNGFGYLQQGNFIYVYTNEELKQIEAALRKRVSKVIRLNYLNATDAKEFVSPLLSKDGGEIKTNDKTPTFSISDNAPTGKDDYALGATIVVIDFEENIKAIEDLVKQLDTRPAQVLVEATILQTSLNEANAFGVDFSIIGDLDFTDFLNIGGPLAAANSLIRGGPGSGTGGLSPADNQGKAIVSNPGNTLGPATFKVGIVSDDVSIFLRMLDTVTDTVILSNPKVLALNRQPARVLVGKKVGYLSTTSTETSTTQTVEFLDTGTQLYFRPFVSSEGEIRMELKPKVSAAEIRTVTDASGAAVTIPDEATQELTTNVNVRDGQTIVLGGLFTENTSFTRRQVPFLGDIPFLGAAFRGNDDSTTRSEIIFLITPSIISDATVAASAQRAADDIERIRAGSRNGLLWWSRDKMTSVLNLDAERAAREGNTQEALNKLQRSLALNSHQPAVYELRERITSEKEIWPNPSMLDGIMDDEVAKRLKQVKPAQPPVEFDTPYGSGRVPREFFVQPDAPAPAPKPGPGSFNSNPNPAPAGAPALSPDQLTLRTLDHLRAQIQLFSAMNKGAKPRLANGASGWKALIDAKLLDQAPANPFVGGESSTVVVIGTGPDSQFQTGHGWIYNPATGQLWAAGFDASGNPLPRVALSTNEKYELYRRQLRSLGLADDRNAFDNWINVTPAARANLVASILNNTYWLPGANRATTGVNTESEYGK